MTAPALTSELLSSVPGIRHGFFTRQGGVSAGLYDSLNVGRGSRDEPSLVEENRARIGKTLGAKTLQGVYQIHSNIVVDRADAGTEADGIVTHASGAAVGILTADCVPVLLAASDGSRVAAVHAGWKGATSGILRAAMAHFGGAEVFAAIGPAIAQQSYEVGQDVFDAAANPAFFEPNGTPGKYHFDLPGLVLSKLHDAGAAQIDWLKEDTYTQPVQFFSYRRATHKAEPDYGRQMSAILRLA